MVSGTTDLAALLRLLTWLSPAFPVGAFAYSGGLERAVHDGLRDAHALEDWVSGLIAHGSAWNDAVLLAQAHAGFDDANHLRDLAALAVALSGSRERHAETLALGAAFITAASVWQHPVFALLAPDTAYPVAVGAVAGAHGIGLESTVAAYLHAVASQQVSAAIRLGISGQRAGVALLAGLETRIADVTGRAARSTLGDLGSAAIATEIAALRHETQTTRLFRS